LGQPGARNVIDLNRAAVELPLEAVRARYLIFLHAAEDQRSPETPSWTDDGNPTGDLVSEYVLEYASGEPVTVPIRRRFAIQQLHVRWGASPFEAVPAFAPGVYLTPGDARTLGRLADGQTRISVERTSSGRNSGGDNLWLYALENPRPDEPLRCLRLVPRGQR